MKYLVITLLAVGNIKGSDCCGSRTKSPSPELNREYYLPPHKTIRRDLREEDLKENDLRATIQRPGIGDGGMPYTHSSGQFYRPAGRSSSEAWEFPSSQRRRSSSATLVRRPVRRSLGEGGSSTSEGGTNISDSSDHSSDTQNLDIVSPVTRPETLCDRLRNSMAGICTQSKWVWTIPTTPAIERQYSFVAELGFKNKTQMIDTRRKSHPTCPTKLERSRIEKRSLYAFKNSSRAKDVAFRKSDK